MNNQTILLILMVIVLALYLLKLDFMCIFDKPNKQSNNVNKSKSNNVKPNVVKQNVVKPNVVKPNVVKPNINANTQPQSQSNVIKPNINANTQPQPQPQPQPQTQPQTPKPRPKLNLIDEYLNETGCEENIQENFNTAGPDMNIGNSMEFNVVKPMDMTTIDRALSNSLVPDFEPSYLNINPNINTYGYALNSDPEINYYAQRGFINPEYAANYADTIQYDLAHPFKTRYCEKL